MPVPIIDKIHKETGISKEKLEAEWEEFKKKSQAEYGEIKYPVVMAMMLGAHHKKS